MPAAAALEPEVGFFQNARYIGVCRGGGFKRVGNAVTRFQKSARVHFIGGLKAAAVARFGMYQQIARDACRHQTSASAGAEYRRLPQRNNGIIPQSAAGRSVPRTARSALAVLNQQHSHAVADIPDRSEGKRHSAEIVGNDGARIESVHIDGLLDRILQPTVIHREAVGHNVTENRNRSAGQYGLDNIAGSQRGYVNTVLCAEFNGVKEGGHCLHSARK